MENHHFIHKDFWMLVCLLSSTVWSPVYIALLRTWQVGCMAPKGFGIHESTFNFDSPKIGPLCKGLNNVSPANSKWQHIPQASLTAITVYYNLGYKAPSGTYNIFTRAFAWSFTVSRELFYDIRWGVRHAIDDLDRQPWFWKQHFRPSYWLRSELSCWHWFGLNSTWVG